MMWLRSAIAAAVGIHLLGLLDFSYANAEESRYALVTKGAFLLSETPDLLRDGRYVYSKEGYLPIGTIVYIGDPITIKEGRKPKRYYLVESEVGLAGHLREDLFARFSGNDVLVPIGRYKLEFWLKQEKTAETAEDCNQTSDCIYFSRDDNVHIDILGPEGENEAVTARLYHHKPGKIEEYGPKIDGFLHQSLIDDEFAAKVIDTTRDPIVPYWEKDNIREDDTIVKKIREYVQEEESDYANFLELLSPDSLQCILSASANAELAFKFFGSGFGVKFDVQLKKSNTMYVLEKYTLKHGIQDPENFTVLRRVRCNESDPERMEQLILQQGFSNPDKREKIFLSDIQEEVAAAESKWLRTLAPEAKSQKMIEIRRLEDYLAVLAMFERRAGQYLGELSYSKRKILLNFLIQQISFYAHPKEESFVPVNVE